MNFCCIIPSEICCYQHLWICAVLTLSTGCSRTTLCYQSSWTTLILCILPGEMCCCLYRRIWAVSYPLNLLFFTSAERIAEWTFTCSRTTLLCCILPGGRGLHYSLYSWRESEQVFPRDIFRLRDSSKLFSLHTTPFFVLYVPAPFVCWSHVSLLVIHEWPCVFSKQSYHCCLIQFVFLIVA